MVSIKKWQEFESLRRFKYKLVIYGSENKKSFIDFFKGDISFCDKNITNSESISYDGSNFIIYSTAELLNFNEPLDIIISPQISYPEVMRLIRCFVNSCNDIYLFLGKRHERIRLNGDELDFKSALLMNYGVDRMYNDINIPIYTYFRQIDDEISKAYDVIVDYKKNYSIKDYIGLYINHLSGKRATCYQPTAYEHHLHIFGDSRVYGFGVEDRFTFSSILQKKMNEHNLKIKVENHGMFDDADPFLGGILNRIQAINLTPEDFLVFCLPAHWIYSDVDIDKSIFYLMNEIKNICVLYGVKFICVNLPSIYNVNKNTELEKFFITEIKNTEEKYPTLNSIIKDKIFRLFGNSIYAIDIQKCFDQPRIDSEVFSDHLHYLKSGNELIAQSIFEEIDKHIKVHGNQITNNQNEKTFPQEMITESVIKFREKISESYESEIYDFLKHIKKPTDITSKIIGVIVVNCDPFTNGHLKIIEYASSQVDYLYVFVVEEDESYFSFNDRLYLVKENTKHINTVIVNPSGKFIISKATFPGYFEKEGNRDELVDCANDLLIFGSNIAPLLNITKRFVGKEPFCNVTREYNKKMKEILPKYNIDVIEIDRFMFNNEYISASKVRKLLEEKNYDEIKTLVPKPTYDLLVSNLYSQNREAYSLCNCKNILI